MLMFLIGAFVSGLIAFALFKIKSADIPPGGTLSFSGSLTARKLKTGEYVPKVVPTIEYKDFENSGALLNYIRSIHGGHYHIVRLASSKVAITFQLSDDDTRVVTGDTVKDAVRNLAKELKVNHGNF